MSSLILKREFLEDPRVVNIQMIFVIYDRNCNEEKVVYNNIFNETIANNLLELFINDSRENNKEFILYVNYEMKNINIRKKVGCLNFSKNLDEALNSNNIDIVNDALNFLNNTDNNKNNYRYIPEFNFIN